MTPALPRRLLLLLALALVPPAPLGAEEPEFLAVRTAGDSALNLRASASTEAKVVARLPAGSVLRNLGCTTAEDRRWCRVAVASGPVTEGWAAADFLIASAPPAGSEPLSAAETACLAGVAQQTDTADVAVLAMDDSPPDVLVQVGVGPSRTPWQCIAAADGGLRSIEFLGTADEAGPPSLPAVDAEAACRAAVAQAAGNGIALVMSSAPASTGTLVRVIVGIDPVPWVCTAQADGTTTDIRRMGG